MSGLDPQGRALVKEILLDLGVKGKTVFFSTHITSDVEKICDRLAIISQGRLQALASVDEIRSSTVESYHVLTRNVRLADLPCVITCSESRDSVIECQVAANNLVNLIEAIKMQGGQIDLVEPVRFFALENKQ